MYNVSRPYVQLIGCYVGNGSLRLFGEHITMAMVVVGHICTQIRAHQSVKTWFLSVVVTRNVFSKCPWHYAFVSVSNAHVRDWVRSK